MPAAGRVGVSSQSGTIGAAVLDELGRHGLGVSTFVAAGNKADVSGNDLLQYWEQDDRTDVVLLYLESFGNPRNFARIARRVSIHTPIVAVKAGRLAPPDEVLDEDTAAAEVAVDALLSQTGVIRVETLEQLVDAARVLADQPLPSGRRVAVLSNFWGPAFLAADACIAAGLELATLSDGTVETLRGGAPQRRAPEQPARADLGGRARRVRRGDGGAGRRPAGRRRAWCCTHRPSPIAPATWPGRWPRRSARTAPRPWWPASSAPTSPVRSTASGGSRPSPSPRPPRWRSAGWPGTPSGAGSQPGLVPELDGAADAVGARALAAAALEEHDGPLELDPVAARALLATHGIDAVEQRLVDGADEALAAAQEIGYPVALKAPGLARPAKTEAGGVAVDVHGDDELRRAFIRMAELHGDAMRPALVQAMARSGVDVELVVRQHPVFGSVLALGPAGTGQLELRIVPLTDVDAERLLEGLPDLDPEAGACLADLVLRLSALAVAVPELVEARLDPVLVSPTGAVPTDLHLRLRPWTRQSDPLVRRLL